MVLFEIREYEIDRRSAKELMMRNFQCRFFGLCLVPILVAALDGSVTLIGQPKAYWAGDYVQALEGTPGFRILMTYGPAAYLAGLTVFIASFVGMILILPRTLALAVCLQFTLGHTIGAFSWIHRFPESRMVPVFINAIVAVGLALGVNWVWSTEQADAQPGSRLPTAVRWIVVVILCLITIGFMLPW